MDPPHQIKYVDDKSILIINKTGKLKPLFVPFKVQCIREIKNIKSETWVYVEQVAQHHEFRIVYRIFNEWIPYSFFRIVINY